MDLFLPPLKPWLGDGDISISWKPYEAAPQLKSLRSLFPKIVFSSATFLDIPTFLKSLGPEDAAVVDVTSTFRPDSSPICFHIVWKMPVTGGLDDL